jgi:hypothetical protein
MFGSIRRAAVTLLTAGALTTVLLGALTASPASAYGKANWQVTFAGTATVPGGGGFGFWGWCDLAGGVTSGNSGDCQFAQYNHGAIPGLPNFTCHVSIDMTAWTGAGGTFVITGDASATPAAVATPCLEFFPGGPSFSGVDTGFPAAPGHYNLGSLGVPGAVGEFNITVTQVP